VTTISRSPISGSRISCTAAGFSKGMTTLARSRPTTLRATPSGRGGAATTSPTETVQPGRSATMLTSCGRLRRTRTIASPSSPRASTAERMASRACVLSAVRSMRACVSNTIQSVSARMKAAAGVGSVKGNSRRRPSEL
jgi:hypothetical protein